MRDRTSKIANGSEVLLRLLVKGSDSNFKLKLEVVFSDRYWRDID